MVTDFKPKIKTFSAKEIDALILRFGDGHERQHSMAERFDISDALTFLQARVEELKGTASYLSAEVKNDWDKGRISVDTFHASLAMDKALAETDEDKRRIVTEQGIE